ncbi:MAG: alpha-1,2-fucosyltransferase [Candidatus Taylorbacteria bacterium]|nr:alpha-1,2-fucosyltransferase [Candidatus Taylorbacteria bacterium]
MIIVKIYGGLGNQMFQYALGRNLSLLHKVPFKIDSSYLRGPNQSGRIFQLDNFNISTEESEASEIASYSRPLIKILGKIFPETQKKYIFEKSETFDAQILKINDGYFDGHWQNENYFKNNENTIRKDFELKRPLGVKALEMAERIKTEPNATSLHIRRGDYVSIKKIADTHGVLPLTYYEKAIVKILDYAVNAHFFISSDDILWVKDNFSKNYPLTFISSPEISDTEELTLMSLCKHNIIANSTMSWWGAWLNKNPGKIVCTPQVWKKDAKNDNPSLPEWIKL